MISDGGRGYFNNRTYSAYPNHEELGGFGNWNGVTVEAWIYLTENNYGTRVIGKIPSYALGFQSSSTSPNRLSASVWPALNQISDDDNRASTDRERSVSNQQSLQLHTWYHIAFTYQNGVGLKLYLNGELVSQSGAITGSLKESRGEPVYIGSLVEPFAGMIDEVRLYNYAQPTEQIYNRYLESRNGVSSNSLFIPSGIGALGNSLACQIIPTDSWDNGAARIFTPLFTTKAQGMGLGSAICKRFVEAHSGKICVQSEKGKGTVFTIALPAKMLAKGIVRSESDTESGVDIRYI